MSPWMRFLLGLDESEVPPEADWRFALENPYTGTTGWVAVLVLLAVVVVTVLLYRQERLLSWGRRLCLLAVRFAALGAIVLMLLDPRIHTELVVERPGTTAVLLDQSASTLERETYSDFDARRIAEATGLTPQSRSPSRAELLQAAWARQGLTEKLGEKNRVAHFTFEAELRRVEDFAALSGPTSGETQASATASTANPGTTGTGTTRLGSSLRQALQETDRQRLTAAIVLSDGRSNAGEAVGNVAREYALRGVPVHAVAVGRSAVAKNFRVTDVSAPQVSELDFPLQVEARVQVAGIRGAFAVALTRKPVGGGPSRRVDEKRLENTGHSLNTRVSFLDTVKKKGRYRYTVSVERHPDELDFSDNSGSTDVTVTQEHRRVLLLASGPSYEFRRVRNFLLRDEGIQASCWLASAQRGYPQDGDIVLRTPPTDAKALRFYDVVILFDPGPPFSSQSFAEALETFTSEQGGGIVFVAGETHTRAMATGARFAGMRRLLPVVLESGGRERFTKPWQSRLTPQGLEHPMCRLAPDDATNRRLWQTLPELYYTCANRGLKPAATALMAREDGRVVLAEQRVGIGHSIFLGSDDLWRWRARTPDVHERFWSAVVRYASLGRSLAGTGESRLYADRDRYQAGDTVTLEASLTDSKRSPVVEPQVEVRVERREEGRRRRGPGRALAATFSGAAVPVPTVAQDNESGSGAGRFSVYLRSIPGQPGWYRGAFPAETAGVYEAALAPRAGKALATGDPVVTFRVASPSSEWEDVTPNFALLEDLAKATGGTFREVADLDGLADEIESGSIRETVGQATTSIWDSAACLLVLCGLLILEWGLRKWWRLH